MATARRPPWLPADEGGGKNTVHALGSTLSYGQRYTAKALLNLTSRKSDDDDAAAAGTMSPEQAAEIEQLIADLGADRQKFLTYTKVESVLAIPERKYRQAIQSPQSQKSALKMLIHTREEGSPAWHAARAGITTASEFSTILTAGRGGAETKTRRTYMLKLAGEILTGEPMDAFFQRPHGTRSRVGTRGAGSLPLCRRCGA